MPTSKRTKDTAKRPGRPRVKDHTPPDGANFYKIREVAQLLRVHEDTVRRMIYGTDDRPPVLASCRLEGSIRIPKTALDAYVTARTNQPQTTKVSAKASKRFGLGED